MEVYEWASAGIQTDNAIIVRVFGVSHTDSDTPIVNCVNLSFQRTLLANTK